MSSTAGAPLSHSIMGPNRTSTHPASSNLKSRSTHQSKNVNISNHRASYPHAIPNVPTVANAAPSAAATTGSTRTGPSRPHSTTSSSTPLDRNGRPIDLAELRAKKQVQAFFKAFADSLEPNIRRTLSSTLSEQETIARSRLKEIIEDSLEGQRSRVTKELVRKRYEERLVRYHSQISEYHSRKNTTVMLFLLELGGIGLLALLYSYEVMSGHLGAITSFTLSAVYTIFMWKRSMLDPPKRPCPYESIAGPPPIRGEGDQQELPRSTWYERNLRWLPLPNRHTVKRAYGLFD